MSAVKSYVRTDEHGDMRVGPTRVMLDSVIAAYHRGESPGSIVQQYPSLTPEEAYGSITYSLAHREEVDEYLARQEAVWEAGRARSEADSSDLIERLRQIKRARGQSG